LKIGLPANNSAKMQPTDHTSIAEAYGKMAEGGEKKSAQSQAREKGHGSDDARNLQS
jgi:hypothetical protein